MVLKIAEARAGLHDLVTSNVQARDCVLNPSTEPRKRKIKIAKAIMKIPTYWYSVNRNDVEPVKYNSCIRHKQNKERDGQVSFSTLPR